MAITVEGTITTNSGDGTSATITVPSPAGGVLAGDRIVYCLFHCESEDNTYTLDSNVDETWQSELPVGGTPPSIPALEVHCENASGGEEGATRTFTASFAGGWMVHCLVLRGVDAATALDVTPTTATGTTLDPDGPSIDPVTDDCLILVVGVQDTTNANTLVSHPTNYTGAGFINNTAANPTGGNSMAAYRIISGSAAEDPGTWDIDTSDEWSAVTIAVRPASGLPAISTVSPDPLRPHGTATVTGSNLGSAYDVWIGDSSDFATATKVEQTDLSGVSASGFTIDDIDLGVLKQSDDLWLFTDDATEGTSPGFQITVSNPDVHVAQGVYVTTTDATQTLVDQLPFKPKIFILSWTAVTSTSAETGFAMGWGLIGDNDAAGNVTYTQNTGVTRALAEMFREMEFSQTPQAQPVLNIYDNELDTTPMTATGVMQADGLDLTNVTNAVAGYRVHWIAIGGNTVQTQMATGVVSDGSVTGISLRGTPDVVMVLSNGFTVNASSGNGLCAFGCYDGTNQWFTAYYSEPSSGPNSKLFTTGCAGQYLGNTMTWEMAATSMNSDGFSWNGTNTDEFVAIFLHLDGQDVQVGNFTKATGAAPATQTVSTNAKPGFVLLASGGKANETQTATESYQSQSFGSALVQGGQQHHFITDVGATINSDRQSKESSAISISNDGTDLSLAAEGSLTNFGSLDSPGFDVTWNPNDGSADIIGFLSIELANAQASHPFRNPWLGPRGSPLLRM